jgi:uncharacterized protein (DUF885 family)
MVRHGLIPALALLVACAPQPERTVDASNELNELVEAYFDEMLELNPVAATFLGDHRFNDRFPNSIGPEHRERVRAVDRRYLAAAEAIDPGALDGQDSITRDIFVRDRRRAIEGAAFPAHLMPLNQMFSTPNFFVQLGSGAGAQPFATAADYDAFLGRIDGFAVWMAQAEANLREGVERDVTLPRIVVERVLPQLASQLVVLFVCEAVKLDFNRGHYFRSRISDHGMVGEPS